MVLDGALLAHMEAALSRPAPQPDVLTMLSDAIPTQALPTAVPSLMAACMPALSELKAVLRSLIHYHLGSQTLRTRQLMMELQQS